MSGFTKSNSSNQTFNSIKAKQIDTDKFKGIGSKLVAQSTATVASVAGFGSAVPLDQLIKNDISGVSFNTATGVATISQSGTYRVTAHANTTSVLSGATGAFIATVQGVIAVDGTNFPEMQDTKLLESSVTANAVSAAIGGVWTNDLVMNGIVTIPANTSHTVDVRLANTISVDTITTSVLDQNTSDPNFTVGGGVQLEIEKIA
jgi:hypothetical protein